MNTVKIIEMLVPVLIKAFEVLLKRLEKQEEEEDRQQTALHVKDSMLANAVRNSEAFRNKTDEQIIEEAFA